MAGRLEPQATPPGIIDPELFDRVMTLGPQEVVIRDPQAVKPLLADVPVFAASESVPEAVLSLELRFEWLTRALVGNPRLLTFLADQDGRLLLAPGDVTSLHGRPSNLKQIPMIPVETQFRGPSPEPIRDLLRKRVGRKVASQTVEERLRHPSRAYLYQPPRPLWILMIDAPGPKAVVSVHEALRKLETQSPREFGAEILFPNAVHPEYPYRHVRSSDLQRLRRIKATLKADRALNAQGIRVRGPHPLDEFHVRLVCLPYDPERPERFLVLGIGVSVAEILGDFQRDMNKIYGSAAALLGVALLASVVFSRMLTRPLRRITLAAEALPRGQFDRALPVEASDEIGVLARAFGEMVEQIRHKARDLRENLAQTKTILDMAAEGIITINSEGRVESFNRAAERMLGYSQEKVVGRHVRMLLVKNEDEQIPRALGRLLSSGLDEVLGKTHELVGRRRDGSTFPAEVAIGEAYLGDRRIFIAIVRDITVRKQAEQAVHRLNLELEERVCSRTAELARKNEELIAARDATEAAMKSQEIFLSNVAHDLRTPLTIVIGYSEDLLRKATKLGQDAFIADLKLVVNRGKELLELINDLLNMSRAMNGRELELDLKEFDVATMLRQRMEGIEHLAKQYRNTVTLDCSDNLGTMCSDEARVWRILMNLLTNACKFTKKGRVTLGACREAGDGEGRDRYRSSGSATRAWA